MSKKSTSIHLFCLALFCLTACSSSPDSAKMTKLRVERLQRIGKAITDHHEERQCFPIERPKLKPTKDGKPPVIKFHLSWRVYILPYLGEEALFKKFRLDEPWDGPNNIKLLAQMPEVFKDPVNKEEATKTRVIHVSGKETMHRYPYGMRNRDLTDGTLNTIYAIFAAPEFATEWTKPDNFPNDAKASLKYFQGSKGSKFFFIVAEGSAGAVDREYPAEEFHKLNTPHWADPPSDEHKRILFKKDEIKKR